MGIVYVGLEAGSSTCHVVGVDRDGRVVHDGWVETGEKSLERCIKAIGGELHVHLEAGELAGWIRRVIRPHVARVVVGDPKRNAWIAKDPLKGDPIDAFKLAELLRMKQIHEVYYTDLDERTAFKQVVQDQVRLTRQIARLKTQLKSRYRAYGVIERSSAIYTPKHRDKYLAKLPSKVVREAVRCQHELIEDTMNAGGRSRKLMARMAKGFPEIGTFLDVPGVGLVGACRFSAYIQTPYRFSKVRKVWRYCRLGITDRTSDGKQIGHKRLDRNGVGILKDMSRKAFIGAMSCKSDNQFKRTYFRVLETTHNEVHARLTTQRKIVSVLYAMWRDGTEYRDDMG